MNKELRKNLGMTMIEVLVGVLIMGLIGVGVAYFGRDVFFLNIVSTDALRAQQEVRFIFSKMIAEIRSASQSSVGAYPIETASEDTFTFYGDIDDDGLKERVRYFKDGISFKKGILKPAGSPLSYNPANETMGVLTGAVENVDPIFNYYDTNYNGTTAPLNFPVNIPDIRLVKITLLIDRTQHAPAPITATTQVSLRNLKDNY